MEMKLIDLSRIINSKTPVYPGDKKIDLQHTKYLKTDKYNNHVLSANMHSGTHIDGPMHLLDVCEYIDDISLEKFVGNGCLIDGRGKEKVLYDPSYETMIKNGDIVLVFTGHDKTWGAELYFSDYPTLDDKLTDLFVRKEIKMLGVDTPSPDRYPFLVHKKLLSNGILIMENLTNLSHLRNERFEVIAFPLKIEADSSMVRAIARIVDTPMRKYLSRDKKA